MMRIRGMYANRSRAHYHMAVPDQPAHSPLTVLLVDDDPATLRGLVALFGEAGFQCTAVDSFESARRCLRESTLDVIVTDVRLGAHNGLQLVLNRPPTVAAVVISGFDDPVLRAEAQRAGATYRTKPVDPRELVQVVRDAVARERGRNVQRPT